MTNADLKICQNISGSAPEPNQKQITCCWLTHSWTFQQILLKSGDILLTTRQTNRNIQATELGSGNITSGGGCYKASWDLFVFLAKNRISDSVTEPTEVIVDPDTPINKHGKQTKHLAKKMKPGNIRWWTDPDLSVSFSHWWRCCCDYSPKHGCTVFVLVTMRRQRGVLSKEANETEEFLWCSRKSLLSPNIPASHLCISFWNSPVHAGDKKEAASVEAHQPSASDLCHFYVSYQAVLMLLKPCGALSCARWKTLEIWVKRENIKGGKKIEHSWEIVWDGSCWSWGNTVCFIDWQAEF